jgi:hypothetical protein
VIPTWRPPSETPTPPALKPVPEVRANPPRRKGFKDTFAHFTHTFTNETTYLRITDVEYYARFTLKDLRKPFTGLMYMNITIAKR